MKFGDIVENTYASNDNPDKFGIFIKRRIAQREKAALVTDLKGNPHTVFADAIKVVGSIWGKEPKRGDSVESLIDHTDGPDTETRLALMRQQKEDAERRAMTLSRRVDELLARIAKLEAERDQS